MLHVPFTHHGNWAQSKLTYRSSLLSLGHVKTFFHVTRLLAVFMLHSWCIHGVFMVSTHHSASNYTQICQNFAISSRPRRPPGSSPSARRLPPEFMVRFGYFGWLSNQLSYRKSRSTSGRLARPRTTSGRVPTMISNFNSPLFAKWFISRCFVCS